MALPSGADVKIGDYEFMIEWADADPVVHYYESLYARENEITGQPGKHTANPNFLLWTHDDWSGGEGTKYFDSADPTTYWYGKVNPRILGALNGTPAVTATTSLTTTTATPTKLIFVSAAGTLWLLANRQLFYSTNGTSWTAHGSNPIGAASDMITAACSDGDEIWYSTINGTTREVWKATTSTVTQAVADVTGPKFIGMAELEGFVYGYTGKNLIRYNTKKTLPITQNDRNKVYKPHTDSPAGTYYGGVVATENSICFMIAYKGDTTIYQFRKGRAFPIWQLPGETGKAIAYKQGVLAVLTQQGTKCVLRGLNVQTRQPFHLADVGVPYSLTTAYDLAAGPGSTLILAAGDGTTSYLYSYDLELDALSEVGEATVASQGTPDAVITYEDRRLMAYYSSTTVKADSWASDEASTTTSWEWVSAAYDLGFPQDQKLLLGLHVVQDGTVSSGTVTVYYQLDEDGTWTSAGSTSNGDKHKFIDLTATSKKFRTLRLKITGASGARLFSVTAKAYMNSYQQAWRLVLKLKDEARGAHPTSRIKQAHVLRDYLHTLQTAQNIVTFLDGTRYPKKGGASDGYTSHTVVVEFPEDHIAQPSEGTGVVILRDVTTS